MSIRTIDFPESYPIEPPKVKFTTKIYHCNVSAEGGIYMPMLKDEWTPQTKIRNILSTIVGMLMDPNPDEPLMPEIAGIFKINRTQFDKTASEWTSKFAM